MSCVGACNPAAPDAQSRGGAGGQDEDPNAGGGTGGSQARSGGNTADSADARPSDPRGGAGGANVQSATPADLEVTSGDKVVNECFTLMGASGSQGKLDGPTKLPIGKVLLWQVQDAFARAGDAADVSFSDKLANAGKWEMADVINTMANAFETREPIKLSYRTGDGGVAQVCTVPAFTTVTVARGARVQAPAWNGKTGGVLAFNASGVVTIDGELTATGAGFRGGPWSSTHFHGDSIANKKVTDLNTTMGLGGFKGEGMDSASFGADKEGRGNIANGAGGGNNTHAGGGGGGGAARGGFGGFQHAFYGAGEPNTRGMGGVGVRTSLSDRLVMGGGGGQGQQVISDQDPKWCKLAGLAKARSDLTRGGTGGGVVLINARMLRGQGSVAANGTPGGCAEFDGAGGGGAGGAVWLTVDMSDFTGRVTVAGGDGGDNLNTNKDVGPGGGGGGGQVQLTMPALARAKIVTSVDGGKSGLTYSGELPTARPKSSWGATGGGAGLLQ